MERLIIKGESNEELIRQHIARYNFVKKYVEKKNVIDIACGSGYGVAELKNAGASRVLGVDISQNAIDYAKANYTMRDVDFIVGQAESFSFHGKFDVIVSFETIEHIQNPERFLEEITRSLLPKGVVIISTPAREKGTLEDKPDNPSHLCEWSPDEFQMLLSRYFTKVHMYYQFNFKKWFPYSRKLQHLFFRIFFPRYAKILKNFHVISVQPKYAGFKFDIAYSVAICEL